MNVHPQDSTNSLLTPQERAAIQLAYGQTEYDGELVSPIPADAPGAPKRHWTLGKPSQVWTYRDAHGATLFYILRFDPPGERKIFLPLSLWRDGAGLGWRWNHVPPPRALYNLDKLAARPDAPVVICEGEKSAHAAARIFPDSVCVTSPGGSGAEAQADWTPLSGRKVLIWPDRDMTGAKYAGRVAHFLHDRQCEVSIIDAAALASLSPNGGKREPTKKGWDAADAADEWQHLEALHDEVMNLLKPFDPGARGYGANDGPLPLFPQIPDAEPFPLGELGLTLSRAAKAIANKVQVPAALAAQSVLAVASLAACAHADVKMPFGQCRPSALFFATVAASGDRKSTADNEALWPVFKYEKSLLEEAAAELKTWRVAHAAWQAEKRKIEGNSKIDLAERRDRLAALGDEPSKPLEAFLVTGDLTIEGLAKTWPNAHAALGVFTAEGGTFTAGHGMNDDNRLKTAAMLSELWDGKPIKRVRALDGVSILHGRRLAMHLLIQPDAAAAFLCNDTLRDQGLLSRVLVAAPASLSGTRLYKEPHPNDIAAIHAYGARMLSILEAEPMMAPGTRNELEPRALPIAPEAATIWRDFHDHVETQCSADGPLALLRDFAAKAAEHAARIAGVLTIVEDLQAREIRAGAMRNALALADWYVNEAVRLQQAGGRCDPRLRRAALLLEWIKSQPGGKATISRILTHGPNALRTKAGAEEALAILLDHRWIIEVSSRPRIVQVIGEARE